MAAAACGVTVAAVAVTGGLSAYARDSRTRPARTASQCRRRGQHRPIPHPTGRTAAGGLLQRLAARGPFLITGCIKCAYDLTLWHGFRRTLAHRYTGR